MMTLTELEKWANDFPGDVQEAVLALLDDFYAIEDELFDCRDEIDAGCD